MSTGEIKNKSYISHSNSCYNQKKVFKFEFELQILLRSYNAKAFTRFLTAWCVI